MGHASPDRGGVRFTHPSPKPAWVNKPDVSMPSVAFWQQPMISLLIAGNAFIRLFKDGSGPVVYMGGLNPLNVQVSSDRGGVRFPHPSPNALGQKFYTSTVGGDRGGMPHGAPRHK